MTGISHRGFLLAALACLAACGEPAAPEVALRDWVARVEAAAESRDRGALMDLVAPAYADARGNERDDIDRLLRYWFLRQQDVGLLISIDELAVHGDSAAELVLNVGMAGRNDGTFGFSADAYRFELELQAAGDDWLLIGARWGEIGRTPR